MGVVLGVTGLVEGLTTLSEREAGRRAAAAPGFEDTPTELVKIRDKHLRSRDFLDVERYPQIEFRAERIEQHGQDEFRIGGPLTIHGVTRPVELVGHVYDHGADIREIRATGTLDRYQFGVKAWQPMEFNLSRKVKLELDLTLERA